MTHFAEFWSCNHNHVHLARSCGSRRHKGLVQPEAMNVLTSTKNASSSPNGFAFKPRLPWARPFTNPDGSVDWRAPVPMVAMNLGFFSKLNWKVVAGAQNGNHPVTYPPSPIPRGRVLQVTVAIQLRIFSPPLLEPPRTHTLTHPPTHL